MKRPSSYDDEWLQVAAASQRTKNQCPSPTPAGGNRLPRAADPPPVHQVQSTKAPGLGGTVPYPAPCSIQGMHATPHKRMGQGIH